LERNDSVHNIRAAPIAYSDAPISHEERKAEDSREHISQVQMALGNINQGPLFSASSGNQSGNIGNSSSNMLVYRNLSGDSFNLNGDENNEQLVELFERQMMIRLQDYQMNQNNPNNLQGQQQVFF